MKITLPPAIEQMLFPVQEYIPHLIAIGGFLFAGVLIGVFRMSAPQGLADQKEVWRLPQIAPDQVDAISNDLLIAGFWSEGPREVKKTEAETTVKAPIVPPWQFIGTTDQGATYVAVILIEGKKLKRLKVDELLPDGSKIVAISDGQLSYEQQGAVQTLRLFVEKK